MSNMGAKISKSKWPMWNEMPSGLRVGVEEEHFIFRNDGQVPSIEDTKNFFEELVSSGLTPKSFDTDGRPLSVSLETNDGYTSIKNDFCTHIIEVAVPPRQQALHLLDAMRSPWNSVSQAALKCGLTIHTGAILEKLPKNFQLLPHPRREWLPKRPTPQSSLHCHKYFNIMMCSTQIHLNILAPKLFEFLPALYAAEYLIPLAYTNSKGTSAKAHCLRPLIWQDSFIAEYKVFGFPSEVPASEEQYAAFLESSSDYQRDYTFIAPREFGTVEFRAGCAQDNFQDTLALAALRIAIVLAVYKGLINSRPDAKETFFKACRSGTFEPAVLQGHLSAIDKIANSIPSTWLPYFRNARERLERIRAK
jgi:hypothetical protein